MEFLGIEIDPEKNAVRGPSEIIEISTPNSKVKVLIVIVYEWVFSLSTMVVWLFDQSDRCELID